ncbi:CaiB/BaiF CoA transferase family protein [Ottowia thiooxydans]|uniref:CaiB/BaiF CoA transferase family protein n=1 Tax=Ottowia thiooxydans TaxID=219182 RepID=UPI00040250E0|nr:CoA transferase [Ottowia thiooxydans]
MALNEMTMVTQATPKPLLGVRVVDFTTVLAGPYCSYQLALLGAEVTKLERPDGGDWARSGKVLPDVPEFSAQFVAQNAAKRSITLNLRSERGRELALQLIAQADVVVENFAGGVADRLGIGYEAARSRRPNIVYCAMSGWGQTGPMAPRPAYDHVVQAASGITMLTGTPETAPNRIGPPLFDYLTGIYGAFAVLAALRERDRTGQAQMVDIAMLDTGLVAMASTLSAILNTGAEPQATGNTAASGASASGIFETADGLLSMTGNQEAQTARLCEVLGLSHLLNEVRFATEAARVQHAGAFRSALTTALLKRPAREWETLLAEARVPATRVRTVSEALAEPQVQKRGVVQKIRDPSSGVELHVPGLGFLWNSQPVGPAFAPPRLGEHTGETLHALGLNGEEINALRRDGII